MNMLIDVLSRRRLVVVLMALLVLVGIVAWNTMPRQEDPSFKSRIATIVVHWPGADPLRVERLVVRPIEDALSDVPELRKVNVTARTGGAAFIVELRDAINETKPVWDAVRVSLAEAGTVLPEGAGPIVLNEKQGDPASIVLFVTGTDDLLALRRAARDLEDELLKVRGVARVERIGDPGEQVSIRMHPAVADRLGLDPQTLAGMLRARNTVVPGGGVVVGGRRAVLAPRAELPDVEAFRATPWGLPDGSAVPLGELARIELEPTVPARQRLFHNGDPAVGVSVIPELPQDLVDFGGRIDGLVAELEPRFAEQGLAIETFASQPAHVAQRLGSLTGTLMISVGIVAGVLLVTMGLRLGLVVASVVPMVTLSTVAVYAMGGGVLHQISIASMVLALGLLVDNAIVVAETVQRHLDAGLPPDDAMVRAIRELAAPLGVATGTTVAAFVPMLVSEGVTADFTRSIPQVLLAALGLSYVFALAVTPALAAKFQRPGPERASGSRVDAFAQWLGRTVVRTPRLAMVAVTVLVVFSVALLPFVSRQFFPFSDRPRVLVSVELPEGAPLAETERTVAKLETLLSARDDVVGVSSFIGQKVPRFYYNLTFPPSGPHRATLVFETARPADVPDVVEAARDAARQVPEATVVPKRLQQGPPAGAPVEVRLAGRDLADLQVAAEAVMRTLRGVPASRDVRHDLGIGTPSLTWSIHDAAAGRRHLNRRDVALSLLGRTRGLPAGEARGGRDPVPVFVTTPEGEYTPPSALANTTVGAPGATSAPLSAIARQDLVWAPASVNRRNSERVVTVSAQIAEGYTYSDVTASAAAFEDGVPDSVEVTLGGEAERSSEANTALLSAMPLGLAMLLLFLFLEFDSLRRVAIVLVTVPLAAVGVIPGLAVSGQPFGFMSLLGVISLVGIVVNNAIVLLDVIERRRKVGATSANAVTEAVRLRTRPILLTTATTVTGMLPLALSSSPLWPPLAWAIISGLLASTVLTLVAVPALYQLLCSDESPRWLEQTSRAIVLAVTLLMAGPALGADAVTLGEAVQRGADAPVSVARMAAARAALMDARTAAWAAYGPTVGAEATAWRRNVPLQVGFDVPGGPSLAITQQPERLLVAGAEASVPLVDPARIARIAPARRSADAAGAGAIRARQLGALAAAEAWLDVRVIDAQRAATEAYVASLRAVYDDLAARLTAELVVEADVLRAEVVLLDAEQQARALDRRRAVATRALGAAMGVAAAVEPRGPLREPLDPPAVFRRRDLEAAQARVAALEGQRTAVLVEALPSIEVYGSFRALDQDNLIDNHWVEGGVRARWTPVARGTRPSRRRAASARVAQAHADLDQVALTIEVERAAAEAARDVATREVEVRERAVAQATLVAEQFSDRYRQGLVTLTDVLQVQAELRNQRTRHEVAKVEAVRASLRQQVALGGLPRVE